MTDHAAPVLTPDQRLRVFISSALVELAPERVAARGAIERLQLTTDSYKQHAVHAGRVISQEEESR